MRDPIKRKITIFQSLDFIWSLGIKIDSLPRAPWTASTPYVVGDLVTATTDPTSIFLVVGSGASLSTEPAWTTIPAMGGRITGGATFMRVASTLLLDTSTYSARFKVRSKPGDTVYLTGSDADGRVQLGYDPPKWTASTVKATGNQVLPTTPNGWRYQAESAGTTGSTQPASWPTTPGAVVVDGGVTWRNVSSDADASNLRIGLANSYTATLDFAWGVYQLDLIDPFGVIVPLYYGDAVLEGKIAEA